jgi:hypothetical protein
MEKTSFSLKAFIKRHRFDLILVLSLIFIALLSLILIFSLRTEGGSVKVEIDGALFATYSLLEDGEYSLGDGNILKIEGGEARMSWADCPDKTCVMTRPIRYNGESIICLPHKIAVTVISTGDDGGADLESR